MRRSRSAASSASCSRCPIVGSLLPPKNASGGSWAPLSAQELDAAAKGDGQAGEADLHAQVCRRVSPRTIEPGVRLGHQSRPREVPKGAHRHLQSARRQGRPSVRRRQHGLRRSSARSARIWAATTVGTTRRTGSCARATARSTRSTARTSPGPAPRGLDPLPLREQNGKAEVTWIDYQSNTPHASSSRIRPKVRRNRC